MFEFDETFLESVGLTGLPEEQKKDFLNYAQDQLEIRIGESMSAGLSEEQLLEFEHIIDNDADTINGLIEKYGNYHEDTMYQNIKRNTGAEEDDAQLMADYVTAKWLDDNCPHYRKIIEDSIESLRSEIREQRDVILAAK